MLEKLFPGWGGKAFVLVLLGFASTDFVITMTLSAADATAHFIHNPYTPHILQNQMAFTLFLIAVLGGNFPQRIQGGDQSRVFAGCGLSGAQLGCRCRRSVTDSSTS